MRGVPHPSHTPAKSAAPVKSGLTERYSPLERCPPQRRALQNRSKHARNRSMIWRANFRGGISMKYFAGMLLAALLAIAPAFAQAPKGWKYRSDHSSQASDPDAPGAIKFTTTANGFHAVNPRAAVYWNPANTASGNYTLKGTFKLIKSNGEDEYYGLIFGGSALEGPSQSYLYFMVTDDGTYLIKRREGSSTQGVSPKTANAAVKKPDAGGMATNALEVRVKGDKIEFVINGTTVTTLPKTGAAAKTDGIYGIRINHQLDVQIDGFGVSKM